MRILGVDPGTARVGWAVIEGKPTAPRAVAYGCLTTPKNQAPEQRLLVIFRGLVNLLKKYQPDYLSLEQLFFASNAKTAFSVSQARGVILLAAAQTKIPVVSYTPLAVKNTICGFGKAEKIQVQNMVARILHLKAIPKPDDAADALAIALTHAYSYKMKEQIK